MRKALLPLALILAAPATAQTPERVDITLSSFKIAPKTILLHHGRTYILHFTNTAGGGHDFVAKAFFAAAGASGAAKGGEVELDGHASADVRVVAPAAGRYPAHCSHFMHSTFGMTGEIVVD